MNPIPRPIAKRCGRTRRHNRHPWVEHPDSDIDFHCDGRVGPRNPAQLLIQTPTLRGIRGAGVVIAEGAISA